MNEVGLVPFARVALEVGRKVMPAYSHRFSPRRFTQPQLLAILCLMRYEEWTFRAAEIRLAEHGELRRALELEAVPDHSTLFRFMLRLDEALIAQALAEVVRRLQKRRSGSSNDKSTVAVDATGLAPGAISTFFIRRREHHGGAPTPYRYWLKWLLVIDTHRRFILAQKAHHGPTNDCATLPLSSSKSVRRSHSSAPSSPMPSSIANATIIISVSRSEPRASFHPSEANRAGNSLACVRKCEPLFRLNVIGSASMPKPSSVRSNANSRHVLQVAHSLRNANKLFCSASPTTSTSSGCPVSGRFMRELFNSAT